MTVLRTKIVCTIGPASDSVPLLVRLIEAGMRVARVNFSHGTHESHARTIANVRAASKASGLWVPVMQDLSGPKLRIGSFADGAVMLEEGAIFTLTSRDVVGDASIVQIECPEVIESVKPGDHLLMADGELGLVVERVEPPDLICRVTAGGELRSRKGLHAPGVRLSTVIPTEKDLRDLVFGIAQRVDLVALSFVRDGDEIGALRKAIADLGGDQPIVAKIETVEALDNLDEIIRRADALMVARGDLGIQMPLHEVPFLQKMIVGRMSQSGKPDIVATQMLESMIHNPRPTRAEVTDVANAVFEGADAIMLSGETAVGRYPVETVQTMAGIALAAEDRLDYAGRLTSLSLREDLDTADAIAHAACVAALQVGARLIICFSRSGLTARHVAKYRPNARIAVVSPSGPTRARAALLWGVVPLPLDPPDETDAMIAAAKQAALAAGLGQPNDPVIIVAGIPMSTAARTNMLVAQRL